MGVDSGQRDLDEYSPSHKKLHEIGEVAEDLMIAKNIDKVGEITTEYALNSFDAMGGFWQYNGTEEELIPVIQNERSDEVVPQQPVFTGGESIAWEYFIQGDIEYVPDISNRCDKYNTSTKIKSEIYIPIGSDALLIIASTEVDYFSHLETKILHLLQNILISAMERITREESYRVSQDVYDRVFRHNIRNQLNIIQGFAKTVQDRDLADQAETEVQRIINASEELQQTTQKVSTIQNVIQSPHNRGKRNVSEIIDAELETVHDEYNCLIKKEYSRSIRATCHNEIEKAFAEIFNNAVRHNTSDQPVLTVQAEKHERFVSVVVKDNGPGIPEDELEAIRNKQETKLKHGSGLGIWLADRVITHSGGTIMFDTEAENGTQIEIILPN